VIARRDLVNSSEADYFDNHFALNFVFSLKHSIYFIKSGGVKISLSAF
jgi:hypothetical protein